MTKKVCLPLAAMAAVGLLAVPARGDGAGGGRNLRAALKARDEVPLVVSAATGRFRAVVAEDGLSFDYTLNYGGFEGTVTQSHIHIGQKFAAGGISVWLCQTPTNPAPAAVAAQTPMCGDPGGDGDEAAGTISAEDVIGPTGQAVPATAFADLMSAIHDHAHRRRPRRGPPAPAAARRHRRRSPGRVGVRPDARQHVHR